MNSFSQKQSTLPRSNQFSPDNIYSQKLDETLKFDDSMVQMQKQRQKLIAMQQLYNQTETLVESLTSMSQGDAIEEQHQSIQNLTSPDRITAPPPGYAPVRCMNSTISQSQLLEHPQHHAATEPSALKHKMKKQNAQLSKMLAKTQTSAADSKNAIKKLYSTVSQKSSSLDRKLLSSSQVKKQKIQTPLQYQMALKIKNKIDRKTRNEKSQERRLSGTRFASDAVKSTSVRVLYKQPVKKQTVTSISSKKKKMAKPQPNISDQPEKSLNFSGYVNTTHQESNACIFEKQKFSLFQLNAHQSRTNSSQHNTFGLPYAIDPSSTENYELRQESSHLFDHRQKLSGITSQTSNACIGKYYAKEDREESCPTHQRTKSNVSRQSQKSQKLTKTKSKSSAVVLKPMKMKPNLNKINSSKRSGNRQKFLTQNNLPNKQKLHSLSESGNNTQSVASLQTAKTQKTRTSKQGLGLASRNSYNHVLISKSASTESNSGQVNIRRAEKYFYDLTIRKFFCLWIEKFIQKIKDKKMATLNAPVKTTLSQSEHQATITSKKSRKVPQTVLVPTQTQKQDEVEVQQVRSHRGTQKSKMPSNVSAPYVDSTHFMALQSYSIQQEESKSDFVITEDNHQIKQDEEDDTSESIVNIESKNEVSLDNFFAPKNAFRNQKFTRNISTISDDDPNGEFRQTAQLGGEHAALSLSTEKPKKSAFEYLIRLQNLQQVLSKILVKKKDLQKKSVAKSRSKSKSKSCSNQTTPKRQDTKRSKTLTASKSSVCKSKSPTPAKSSTSNKSILKLQSRNPKHQYATINNQKRSGSTSVLMHHKKKQSKSEQRIKSLSNEFRRSEYNLKKRNKLQIYFLKWAKIARGCRVLLKPKLFSTIKLKSKVFAELKKHAQRQAKLYSQANLVYMQRKAIVVSQAFLHWINAFNSNQRQRRNQYIASSYWITHTQSKVIKRWRKKISLRNMYRTSVREVGPTKCLLAMLGIPHSSGSFLGSELCLVQQHLKLCWLSTQTIKKSLKQYQFNTRKRLFKVLKQNYFKISNFKASKAMAMVKQTIRQWRLYLKLKAQLKAKENSLALKNEMLTKSFIIRTWADFAASKSYFRAKETQIRSNIEISLKTAVLSQLHSYCMAKKMQTKNMQWAVKKNEMTLKCVTLSSLISHSNRKRILKFKISRFQHKSGLHFTRRVFGAIKPALQLLRYLQSTKNQVSKQLVIKNKKLYFKIWRNLYQKYSVANQHFDFRLKIKTMQSFKEGVLLSQIQTQKERKAARHLVLLRKRNLFEFLRDYKCQKECQRVRLEILSEQAEGWRLHTIFSAFKQWYHLRLKKHLAINAVQADYDFKLKITAFKSLTNHVEQESLVRQALELRNLKTKQFCLHALKYGVQKQMLLRHSLIQTVETRNIARVLKFLVLWRSATYRKRSQKIDLKSKILKFTQRRVLIKLQSLARYQQNASSIKLTVKELATDLNKKKYFSALKTYIKRPEIQAKIKAKRIRTRNLVKPCYEALKKHYALEKINFDLIRIKDQLISTVLFFRKWQVIFKFKTFKLRVEAKRLRKSFGVLKSNVATNQQDKLVQTKLKTHNVHRIKQNAFQMLCKYQKVVKPSLEAKKQQLQHLCSLQFVKLKLRSWNQMAQRLKLLKKNHSQVSRMHLTNIQFSSFRKMRSVYLVFKNLRTASATYSQSLICKVFYFLMHQAQNTTKLNHLLENEFNPKLRLKRKVFQKLVVYQSECIKARNLKKWGDKIIVTPKPKKQAANDEEAIVHWAKFKLNKAFQLLKHTSQKSALLKSTFAKVVKRRQAKIKKDIVQLILDTYIIQPRLDSVAHVHYLRKNLLRFVRKSKYQMARRRGEQLHQDEVKAYRKLGVTLLHKGWAALKVNVNSQRLRQIESNMVHQFRVKKWFSSWRLNYLVKAQNNYIDFTPANARMPPLCPKPSLKPQIWIQDQKTCNIQEKVDQLSQKITQKLTAKAEGSPGKQPKQSKQLSPEKQPSKDLQLQLPPANNHEFQFRTVSPSLGSKNGKTFKAFLSSKSPAMVMSGSKESGMSHSNQSLILDDFEPPEGIYNN